AIIKKAKDAFDVLNSLCVEMDERYKLLADAGVNKLKDYNEKYKDRKLLPTAGHKYLPYIVVVIDEFADLTMSSGFGQEGKALSRGISAAIIRLAQKGRAAGIHLIIATQRPSVSVITGDIKTNFPMRIAFRTVSRVDSQTILDSPGAENLIGKGDMLFYAGVEMERVQCAYVSTPEIDRITKFIADQTGYKECYTTPYYLPEPPADSDSGASSGPIDISKIDDMFADAARLVVSSQRGSTSDLQRKLGLGYARAGRIMDQLEAAGIVGPQDGSKPRQVLVGDYAELEPIITSFTTHNE
ncbi:MAG: DNA translocase FtsK, partial [Candidatus Cryptobacteroides sp.]